MTNITPVSQLKTLLSSDDVGKRLKDLLGKRAATFSTSVLQIMQSNDMLKNAEPTSVLNAAMVAATLDLPLNNQLGFAYIVPFNTKQKDGSYKVMAQFQLGYKGFIQLAQRSGQFKTIDAKPVYEGQIEVDDSFAGMVFKWSNKKSDTVIGYAAYFQLTNGFEKVLYMTVDEMKQHGLKYSQTYKKKFGLWVDEFDSMAKKTVLKLLLSKYAPLSVEMQQAVITDQATITDDGTAEYVDHVEVKTDVDLAFVKELIVNAQTPEELTDIASKCSDEIKSELKEEFASKWDSFETK